MNIPQIYLVEPYNAYAPKGRKKHWHEVVEEQALMARIIAEQQALLEAKSKTTPDQAPADSAQTVVGSSAGAGATGQQGSAGGGGGVPVVSFFHPPADVVDFSATPLFGAAPLTVQFTNLTPTAEYDSYTWDFGDGTTSSAIHPIHVYPTGSTTFTVNLTSSQQGVEFTASKVGYISSSIPVVTAAFTFTTSSNVAPFSASFVNTSTNTSQTPTTTYLWLFEYDNGTTASFTTTNASTRVDSGSFTASLQATGSYGIASVSTSMFDAAAPTVTAAFTYTTTSNIAPYSASFTSTTAYNGAGTLFAVTWSIVNGNITLTGYGTPASFGINSGSVSASLQVTESLYKIASDAAVTWSATAPTLTAGFTFTTSSNVAPSTATFTNTLNGTGTQYNGTGSLTYLWYVGSGSISASTQVPSPQLYRNYGPFTASLQVTESSYGIQSIVSQSFYLAAPTVTAGFTFTTSSDTAPSTATFTNTTTAVTGSGDTLIYLWDFGSGSLTTASFTPDAIVYQNAGGYTASLQATESLFGIASITSQSFTIS